MSPQFDGTLQADWLRCQGYLLPVSLVAHPACLQSERQITHIWPVTAVIDTAIMVQSREIILGLTLEWRDR